VRLEVDLRAALLLLFCVAPAGFVFAGSVTISPTTLPFGNQVQNTSSVVKQVTFTNGLTKAVTIASITSSLADYTQTNNCPTSPVQLAAGGSCTISVTFTPSALGPRPGTLSVNGGGFTSPKNLSLSGTGVAPVTTTPTTLSFGNQVIKKKSSAKTITVKNNQSVSLTITSVVTTLPDFSTTTTCPLSPSTLAAGGVCSVTGYFTPSVTGNENATLTVNDNASVSPTVSLTGVGIQPVVVNPGSLSFPVQAVGTTSPAQPVTLTNNQTTGLTISSITSGLSDFVFSTTCPLTPNTLAPGANCSASVTFSPRMTGNRSGTLRFKDTAGNTPQIVSLTGTGGPATLVSIAVVPAVPSVAAGLTQQFTATGTYSDSTTQNLTGTATWTSSASSIATISSGGLATGVKQGSSTITATLGAISGSATLAVTPAVLTSISVTPAAASFPVGKTQQLSATGTYSDASTQDLTATAAWTSSTTSIATVNSGGVATGVAQGAVTITATSGTVNGSTTLTITPPALTSLSVTPVSASIAKGTNQQLAATGTFSDGSTLDLTATANWSSSDTSVATVNNAGLASGVAVGSTSVTATVGSITGSTALTVTPATLVSIAVTPAIPTIPLGTTQPFIATGTYTDGSTQNITGTAQWSSDTPTVATISNASGSQGVASSVGQGSATISATSGAVTGSTTLNVTSAALLSLAIAPANPAIALGTGQQFTAAGTYTDGSTQDLTGTASWSSDAVSTATINSAGLAQSTGTGTANVTAAVGTVSSSTQLTVTAAALVSIAISPPVATVPLGLTQQYAATGTFTDGTTQAVTQSGHWSSTAAGVATVSNTTATAGLASTVGTGTTTIGITSGTVNAQATLVVNPAALASIVISPQTPTIALGMTQQFTALGTYTDGTTQDVTSMVTWGSSAATVAIVGNSAGTYGLATSSGPGTVTISATSNSISSSTTLSVTGAVVVSIAITPATATIPLGTNQQFVATGTFSDDTTQDLTASATWTSSAPTVISVTNSGLAMGLTTGTSSVTAAYAGLSGSASLTVGAPVLVAITVTPANPSLALGTTQQLTATGTYSDGSMFNLTGLVSWSAANSGVATVNAAGMVNTVAVGSVALTATLGSPSGTTTITVTPPLLVSLAVTPASLSIAFGSTQQFTATGTYTDGSTQNLTNSVTWSSSTPGIATISNAAGTQGLASGVGIGATTISAAASGIAGNASLTIANYPCVGPCILTSHNDLARDGVVSNENSLTPAKVNGSTFGRVATITGLQGQIYSQPLYLSGLYSASSKGNLILVATEQDYVYAFDADNYQQVWGGSYVPSGENPVAAGAGLDLPCTNITPYVGITGTPVIDPAPNSNPNPVMYFVTKSVDASDAHHQRLHAVDVITGAELFGGPVEIATPPGSPVAFDPFIQNQRSGLVLTYDDNLNPQIYISWASHCDYYAYHGWMMKYTVTSGVLNPQPSAYLLTTQGAGMQGGIWMSGGAPAADSSSNGNLFLSTGNGSYDGVSNFGQSLLKLNSNLEIVDWYTPNDWSCLDGISGNSNCPTDKDLGSGGVVLFNVPNGVPEVVAAGKIGEIYVVYQSNMGHLDPLAPLVNFSPPPDCTEGPPYPLGGPNNIAQCFPGIEANLPGTYGNRSTPAFWNGTLYVAGAGDALRAFSLSTTNVGTFDTGGAVASSPSSFPYPGTATVVSWNGSDPTTGVLWTLQTNGWGLVPPSKAILRAYAAVPSGSNLTLLYQSTTGPGVIKFQIPTVANGKVFVGGQGLSGTGTEGQVHIYGLCPCR